MSSRGQSRSPSALKKSVKVGTPDNVKSRSRKTATPVLSFIDNMAVTIGPDLHYLHFLDIDDIKQLQDKIHGYSYVDAPSSFVNRPPLISHKNGRPIMSYSTPFTVLYLKKDKHYIYPGDIKETGLTE